MMPRFIRLTRFVLIAALLGPAASAWAQSPGGADDGAVPGGTESAGVNVGGEGTGNPSAAPAAPAAQAEQSAAPAAGGAEEARWWSLSLSTEFSHNIARERPSFGTSFSFDPSFTIPLTDDYKLSLGAHAGMSIAYEYGRKDQYGNDNPAYTTVDADVTTLRLGVPFYAWKDAGIKIGSSFTFFIPWTSRYSGQRDGWYFAWAPGLSVSWSKWGVSLSVSGNFQQNVHRDSWVYVDGPGGDGYHLPQYKLGGRVSLGYSIAGFGITANVGISRSWLYESNLSELERIGVSYGAELSYAFAEAGVPVLDQFALSLGITTAGPERRFGGFGDDRVYPGHPLFTTAYFGINWSY